jgi:beta-glucosidase
MRNRTYRYFTGKPLYPFGYGLGYSNFVLSDLQLSALSIRAGSDLAVDANVKNTSTRDGDDVVELYLSFRKSSYSPTRALRGFARISIPAGETRHVHFTLSPRDLSEVNELGERVIVPGLYQLNIGGSQPGSGLVTLEKNFSIHGLAPLSR